MSDIEQLSLVNDEPGFHVIRPGSGLPRGKPDDWADRGDEFWDYVRDGFVSTKALPDIEDVTPKGYYRDTAHTPAYVRSRWKKYVNIIDIIPGAFGTREDAVICTPLGKA